MSRMRSMMVILLLLLLLSSGQTGCRRVWEKLGFIRQKVAPEDSTISLNSLKLPSLSGSEGGQQQDESTNFRQWAGPDGELYWIVDYEVMVAFYDPPELPEDPTTPAEPIGNPNWLNDPSIQQFIAATGVTVLTDWPALKMFSAGLPDGTSVEDAIAVYKSAFPNLVEDVSPVILFSLNELAPNDDY